MSELSIEQIRHLIFDTPQAEGIKKEAGLGSEIKAVTGKNVDEAAKKVYGRYLSELGLLERKPMLETLKEEAKTSPFTSDEVIQRAQYRHETAQADAERKAIMAATGLGLGAGVLGGSKLYDHLTRPAPVVVEEEEEKVAGFMDDIADRTRRFGRDVSGKTVRDAQSIYTASELEAFGLKAFEPETNGLSNYIDEFSSDPRIRWPEKDHLERIYMANAAEASARKAALVGTVGTTGAGIAVHNAVKKKRESDDLNKQAGLAGKAADVLTGRAKANAGQEVLKASDALKDTMYKKDTVRSALADFNDDIVRSRDGKKMLEYGQAKQSDLETLVEAAKERKLNAISQGIENRKAGNRNYLNIGEQDANKAFDDAKGKYDEYVKELHTRADKPLVDKMTPEYIASQKEDYINRLLGLDKEMIGGQEAVKGLQNNYRKQRVLQYGSYGALGAGAVAALPKTKNRPYTEDTQAASTVDPMLYDMSHMASEGDYFEKLAGSGYITGKRDLEPEKIKLLEDILGPNLINAAGSLMVGGLTGTGAYNAVRRLGGYGQLAGLIGAIPAGLIGTNIASTKIDLNRGKNLAERNLGSRDMYTLTNTLSNASFGGLSSPDAVVKKTVILNNGRIPARNTNANNDMSHMASEDDYFEKIAFAAGLLSAGRATLGAAGRKVGQMGVNNAIARKAGQGIAGDTMGQTLKNVGSRAGGFVGDLTGQTRKVMNDTVKNNARSLNIHEKFLGHVDEKLSKKMKTPGSSLDEINVLGELQTDTMQHINDSTNTLKTMRGIKGPVNLAQDKARFGTAVGGVGLGVGHMVGKSTEENEAKKQYQQQRF